MMPMMMMRRWMTEKANPCYLQLDLWDNYNDICNDDDYEDNDDSDDDDEDAGRQKANPCYLQPDLWDRSGRKERIRWVAWFLPPTHPLNWLLMSWVMRRRVKDFPPWEWDWLIDSADGEDDGKDDFETEGKDKVSRSILSHPLTWCWWEGRWQERSLSRGKKE